MRRLNKKGFTLIELLAVIIILGILMIIAIPSVTSYIQNSRKSAYVDTAVAYADAVMKEVNGGKNFRLYSTTTLYMIPVGHKEGTSCVTVESGGQSPFSEEWNYAFIGVTYNGKGYNYYFIGEDMAGQGISMIDKKELTDNGTDYIYSTYGDTAGPAAKGQNTMTQSFAGELHTLYGAGDNSSKIVGGTDETASEAEKSVLTTYVTTKESGKTISQIVYISPSKCSKTESISANNPTPTVTG